MILSPSSLSGTGVGWETNETHPLSSCSLLFRVRGERNHLRIIKMQAQWRTLTGHLTRRTQNLPPRKWWFSRELIEEWNRSRREVKCGSGSECVLLEETSVQVLHEHCQGPGRRELCSYPDTSEKTLIGCTCPFTTHCLPINCALCTNTLMAFEPLSPAVVVSLTHTLLLPQCVVSLWFVWDYYISRGQRGLD